MCEAVAMLLAQVPFMEGSPAPPPSCLSLGCQWFRAAPSADATLPRKLCLPRLRGQPTPTTD